MLLILLLCYKTTLEMVEESHTLTISFLSRPLSTNMRIPNAAKFLTLFAATAIVNGL